MDRRTGIAGHGSQDTDRRTGIAWHGLGQVNLRKPPPQRISCKSGLRYPIEMIFFWCISIHTPVKRHRECSATPSGADATGTDTPDIFRDAFLYVAFFYVLKKRATFFSFFTWQWSSNTLLRFLKVVSCLFWNMCRTLWKETKILKMISYRR